MIRNILFALFIACALVMSVSPRPHSSMRKLSDEAARKTDSMLAAVEDSVIAVTTPHWSVREAPDGSELGEK